MFEYFILKSWFGRMNVILVLVIKLTFKYVVTKLTGDMNVERI